MEGFNVLFLPALALYLAWPRAPAEIAAMALAIVASSGFLLVGTLYWRGIDRRLRLRERAALDQALRVADRAERPLLLATAAAIFVFAMALAIQGWSNAVIAAAALTTLAALEYVNYYHRQLQHFDNAADFKRLFSGGGLKRAHMKRDLDEWRRRSAGERVSN